MKHYIDEAGLRVKVDDEFGVIVISWCYLEAIKVKLKPHNNEKNPLVGISSNLLSQEQQD